MIKKSIFENEIISGMEKELVHKQIKQGMKDLSKAADYLHSAMDIFEDIGMSKKADQVLNVLEKIASSNPVLERKVIKMPTLEQLMDKGLSRYDLSNFQNNDFSRAKFNKVLYEMGFTPHQIASYLGNDQFMTLEEVNEVMDKEKSSFKIDKMIDDSLKNDPNTIEFNSLASKEHHKPKNPTRVSDRHTKGLTPDKMTKNLLHHGTVFNLADDNSVEDLLNADFDDSSLEVLDNDIDTSEMDFEDEI